jgi:hypothetical protein
MSTSMISKTLASCLASCLVFGAALSPTLAHAGEGHDHGDAPPAATGNGPKRQPDGSVFLPKPAQRQWQLRTLAVIDGDLPRAYELSGKVSMDPNAGGKVQASLAGRLQAGPKGLPSLGQQVSQGEVLAYVVPTAGAIERSNQVAQQAELKAARALAAKRLARLQELSDTVPAKEIEAVQSELASLSDRLSAISGGLGGRDTLVAPVSGVIASTQAVAGQVVDARELVFEVVDPQRLRIEALAYDMAQAQNVSGATVNLGGQSVPLKFIGGAKSLRDQALPLVFAATGQALSQLAVGQPLKVYVQSDLTVKGQAVPSAAVLKNPSNQNIVWVKQSPERFTPRVITFEPLDGASVAVTSGLKAGERVVTQGASLLNQIR